jgi:cation diffusion facilitator family transporter
MNADSQIKLKKKAAWISLSIGIGMFFAKMGAYFLTGSAAIFSDAAESVVHVLATSMALYSIILSSKPADESHRYGHGNVEFFSAGIEGMLILTAAVVIIYLAVIDIIAGPQLKSLNIGVVVIASAGLISLALGTYLIRTGKKTNSLTLIADGKHVLTDSVTSIGVVVGIILVIFTDYVILDPIMAIIIALNILYTGYRLIRESIGGLMMETDPAIIDKISNILSANRKDHWIDVHELRYWQSGDTIFIDFHLILPYFFTIEQSHKDEKDIDEKLMSELANSQIKIHLDYCVPELCKFCSYDKCEVRKEDKTIPFEWDSVKLSGDPVYKLPITT